MRVATKHLRADRRGETTIACACGAALWPNIFLAMTAAIAATTNAPTNKAIFLGSMTERPLHDPKFSRKRTIEQQWLKYRCELMLHAPAAAMATP